ncbi:MAG: rhomboid family intramembrane serine protease [Deltaproteobacteria bacterium RIFOXYD12_FULL_57_12]|nr:MAG: rhomboid family intramembrane serine protease [Deltaproteobacteria bacterium RIFOXYD12_FULL_57_12]
MTSTNRRSSLLCPSCRRLVSADINACPYCGTKKPGAWWQGGRGLVAGLLGSDEMLIRLLIMVNGAMYVLALLLMPGQGGHSFSPLAFLAPANKILLLLGGTGTLPINAMHRWWTLLAANYLHGGLLHLVFNMMALNQLGPLIINEYGAARFFVLYTLAGVAGFLLSYLAGVSFTIGASAAVCGLIGAALYYGKSRGGAYGQAVFKQVSGWVISLFVFGFLVPGINNWGHGGGLVAGIVLGALLGYHEKIRENIGHRILAGGCAVLTIGVLGWAVASSIFYLAGAP